MFGKWIIVRFKMNGNSPYEEVPKDDKRKQKQGIEVYKLVEEYITANYEGQKRDKFILKLYTWLEKLLYEEQRKIDIEEVVGKEFENAT